MNAATDTLSTFSTWCVGCTTRDRRITGRGKNLWEEIRDSNDDNVISFDEMQKRRIEVDEHAAEARTQALVMESWDSGSLARRFICTAVEAYACDILESAGSSRGSEKDPDSHFWYIKAHYGEQVVMDWARSILRCAGPRPWS